MKVLTSKKFIESIEESKMKTKNAQFMRLSKPMNDRAAGCLKSGTPASGDEDTAPLVSAEDKRADTNGIELLGKSTLDQYDVLISNGYKGEEVMRWSRYHADQVIRTRQLVLRTLPDVLEKKEQELLKQKRQELENSWLSCPICHAKISTDGKLTKHLSRVHHSPKPRVDTSSKPKVRAAPKLRRGPFF